MNANPSTPLFETIALKPVLRSWQLVLLVWALLLAPQASLVHALSHLAPQHSDVTRFDDQHPSSDKVCDACLAFAQLDAALPSRFEWRAQADAPPQSVAVAMRSASARPLVAFRARAPPALI